MQGARKFVFFSPSGQEKTSAKELVKDFSAYGAEIHVIAGDVVDSSSIEKAIAGVDGEIGGVVLAAMRLEVMISEFLILIIVAKLKCRSDFSQICQARAGITQ